MKKILLTMAIFAIVGSMLFAQNADVSAYNQLSSDTITKPAVKDAPANFAGFAEEAGATIKTETWTAETQLNQKLYSLALTSNYAGPASGSTNASVNGDNWENVKYANEGLKSNFWYRPLAGIELGVGNNFGGYYQVPAGSMLGIDAVMGNMINMTIDGKDNAAGARWAPDGFAFNVTKVPGLVAGVNIPYHGIVDEYDFAPWLNAGAHYNFNDNVNLGLTYHGGLNRIHGHVIGLYGQFKNDTVRIPLGVTFGVKTRAHNKDDDDALRMQIDFAPDFKFRSGMQFGISASVGMCFSGEDRIPLAFGVYYGWPVNNSWRFDVRATANMIINDTANVLTWDIYPKVTYTINAHNSVYVGVKFVNAMDLDDFGNSGLGYSLPVGWKWTL